MEMRLLMPLHTGSEDVAGPVPAAFCPYPHVIPWGVGIIVLAWCMRNDVSQTRVFPEHVSGRT